VQLKFQAIVLHESDNVATLLGDVAQGDEVVVGGQREARITALAAVRLGHKLAVTDVGAGEKVIKYGRPIGVAVTPIRAGEHVHIHNVGGLRAGNEKLSQRGADI
jgi:altronate dehydratase small subunit